MKDKIIEIINAHVAKQGLDIAVTDSTNLINDVGLDSLGLINLLLTIEDELALELDYSSISIDHLKSVDIS
jgi:acyl carrier protein